VLPPTISRSASSVRRRGAVGRGAGLATAAGGGLLFTAIFVACQWPFASFLMSPHARNFFWGARYFDFWLPPESHYRSYTFFTEPSASLARALGIAAFGATLSVAAGRGVGRWLARLRR